MQWLMTGRDEGQVEDEGDASDVGEEQASIPPTMLHFSRSG